MNHFVSYSATSKSKSTSGTAIGKKKGWKSTASSAKSSLTDIQREQSNSQKKSVPTGKNKNKNKNNNTNRRKSKLAPSSKGTNKSSSALVLSTATTTVNNPYLKPQAKKQKTCFAGTSKKQKTKKTRNLAKSDS